MMQVIFEDYLTNIVIHFSNICIIFAPKRTTLWKVLEKEVEHVPVQGGPKVTAK